MDQPDRPTPGEPERPGSEPATEWVAQLPPPPFVDPGSGPAGPRFAPISPRVAVLILAAIVVGIILWMARDAVRPFIVGLLLVYLLDPPVRWLARHGVRRTVAILIVYVIAVVLIVEFLNITLAPLISEIVQFLQDLPALAAQLQAQLDRLSEIYARLALPDAVREWIDSMIASLGQGPGGDGSFDPTCRS
jgi:predicted PurR-regulated permease PerM